MKEKDNHDPERLRKKLKEETGDITMTELKRKKEKLEYAENEKSYYESDERENFRKRK